MLSTGELKVKIDHALAMCDSALTNTASAAASESVSPAGVVAFTKNGVKALSDLTNDDQITVGADAFVPPVGSMPSFTVAWFSV